MVDATMINFDDWMQALKAIVHLIVITHIAKPSSNSDTGFGEHSAFAPAKPFPAKRHENTFFCHPLR
ncbi:hypothetical protein C6366_17555 [Desulfonatronum sp. SC1]|nr:hypothetical protein C6366_17555 [Desulfonatronum sp. SC1]